MRPPSTPRPIPHPNPRPPPPNRRRAAVERAARPARTPPALPAPARGPPLCALGLPGPPDRGAARLRRRLAVARPERPRAAARPAPRTPPPPPARCGAPLRRPTRLPAPPPALASAPPSHAAGGSQGRCGPPSRAPAGRPPVRRKTEEWGAGWVPGKWGPAVSPLSFMFFFQLFRLVILNYLEIHRKMQKMPNKFC